MPRKACSFVFSSQFFGNSPEKVALEDWHCGLQYTGSPSHDLLSPSGKDHWKNACRTIAATVGVSEPQLRRSILWDNRIRLPHERHTANSH
ncbi:hypothetical protein N7453_008668 [Penicillium expansum]|nr:hypothetical protein N7453_008668 [Penicillium expansum]